MDEWSIFVKSWFYLSIVKKILDAKMQHLNDSDSDENELDFDIDFDLEETTIDSNQVSGGIGNLKIDSRVQSCSLSIKWISIDIVVIDIEALRRENDRLKSEITCRMCNNAPVEILFLPCRHLVACDSCGQSLNDCIKCGQKILGTVRTFLIWRIVNDDW